MRPLLRPVLYGLLLAVLTLSVLLALTIETEPLVRHKQESSQQYLAKTKHILHSTVQPNQGGQKIIELTAEDLAAAANFALLKKNLEGYAYVSFRKTRLEFLSTVKLPVRAADLYLNLKLIADDGQPQAVIKQVKLGSLSLPKPVVRWLLHGLMRFTPLSRYGQIGDQLIQEVRISDDRLRVVINWNREALSRAKNLVTDLASKERLLIYHNKLAELVSQPELKRFVPLGSLMQPMFALAMSRSEDENNDPAEENRAIIFVLSAYVNGKNIAPMISSREQPATLTRRLVLLNRRLDTAQHFMASAALAMSGHRTLADMIGIAKEINDTHSGSGFSFTDLAADRAGSMFGKTAVKQEEARKVQSVLSQSADEAVFMPVIKDLPENLSPADFVARFKDINSTEFTALKSRIEERIAACSLYQ